jgi:putative NADH-flavin reductase
LEQTVKLVVLGANGRTGTRVLQAALDRDMDVTAVVRSASKQPDIRHEKLTVMVGDPCDAAFMKRVFRGQDAVISTLGGRRPTRSATSVYFRSADAIVDAAWDTGLKRVLVTSTALLFPRRRLMDGILRRLVPNVVRSANRMERILRASALDWTSARCGFLNDGDEAEYRAEKEALPDRGTSVSRGALARFLVDAVENPDASRAVFGVSSATV